jgi:hypothetical protein
MCDAWGSMCNCSKWVWNEPNHWWIWHWYRQYCIQLDVATLRDLHLLWSKVSFDPEHPIWFWPIALLVKLEPTSWCYSDTCGSVGLGRWTDSDVLHRFMWHLNGDDLLNCGFSLEWLEEACFGIYHTTWQHTGRSHHHNAGWQHLCPVLDVIRITNKVSCGAQTVSFQHGSHLVLSYLLQAARLTSSGDSKYRSGQAVPLWTAPKGRWPYLGLNYSAALPTALDLSSLPSPARVAKTFCW